MPPLAFRLDTQLTRVPAAPVTTRFWGPRGVRTDAVVSTLPNLTLVPMPELYLDRLQMTPRARGGVRAAVRVGGPLPFRARPGTFVLEPDEE